MGQNLYFLERRMNFNDKNSLCEHCRGQKYVFVYWLDRALDEQGIHITDIPSEVFEKIPVSLLVPCHCNGVLFLPSNIAKGADGCNQCAGSTWCFTETAEQAGYRYKKVINVSPDVIVGLSCTYFERCACGDDEQAPKNPEKRSSLKEVFDILKVKVPNLGIGFRQTF
jgi:hypothetical protein